jgi:peptidoglycan/xylan/chitin deacetylase (PgdA/CDA1 family)
VALTFDDGPSPVYTPALLDQLAELDARATFFVLGERARAHPELIHRMRAEGHGVGSHSRSHGRATPEEIEGGVVDLQLVLGRRVRLFRPPHGHIDPGIALTMRRARLDSWLWSINTDDYEPGVTADALVERCRRVRERDVLLLHDGMAGVPDAVDRTATLEAVPRIIELIRSRGLDLHAL